MFLEWLWPGYPTWALLLELILCGALVFVLGRKLTLQADAICEEWGLGRAWVGLLLLAGITSMPELVVGSTGVMLGEPNLSIGNILGSCCFNIAIISVLTLIKPKDPSAHVEGNPAHMLSAGFGVCLIAAALLLVAISEHFGVDSGEADTAEFAIGLMIAAGYVVGMRFLYKFERRFAQAAAGDVTPSEKSRHLVISFALSAAGIIATAIWLTKTGDVLQEKPMAFLDDRPLGGTFVGTFFLAIATSLPEVVTCIAAVRLGRVDMALGNIFGSNMFNIFVLPILKGVSVFGRHPTLLGIGEFNASKALFAGLLAILLTGVAIAGLVYRTKQAVLRFGIDSVLIAVLYVAGMYFILMG